MSLQYKAWANITLNDTFRKGNGTINYKQRAEQGHGCKCSKMLSPALTR